MQSKTLKIAEKNMKTIKIKKVHAKENTEEETPGKQAKDATNPTKNKICCLIGHNLLRQSTT